MGAVSVSLVSSSTRSLIVPPSPRSLRATEPRASTATAPTAATATTPARFLIRAGTAPRSSARFTAKPAPNRTTAISSNSSPNSEPTLSFAASDGAVMENASLDRAHAPTRAAPAAGMRITGRVRSRSGTIRSQAHPQHPGDECPA